MKTIKEEILNAAKSGMLRCKGCQRTVAISRVLFVDLDMGSISFACRCGGVNIMSLGLIGVNTRDAPVIDTNDEQAPFPIIKNRKVYVPEKAKTPELKTMIERILAEALFSRGMPLNIIETVTGAPDFFAAETQVEKWGVERLVKTNISELDVSESFKKEIEDDIKNSSAREFWNGVAQSAKRLDKNVFDYLKECDKNKFEDE